MKTPEHDLQMAEVYAHIYEGFYGLDKKAVESSYRIIAKNLAESQIGPDDLRRMSVLNVGTGREAYVFWEMGAKGVYHFDISDKSVDMLTRLKQKDVRYANIRTQKRDLCEKRPLDLSEPVDFVYLNGVLHHFHDAETGIKNIFASLTPSAKCFFRIYRSGSLDFFMVDYIRRFIDFRDREAVTARFKQRFPEPAQELTVLYDDLYDDFFVPVLHLFDVAQMHRYFEANGFRQVLRPDIPAYDHGNFHEWGQGVSLIYEKISNQKSPGPFPKSVDQLEDISYHEKELIGLVSMMKRFLPVIRKMAEKEKIDLALDLYRATQLYQTRQQVTASDKWKQVREILASKGAL